MKKFVLFLFLLMALAFVPAQAQTSVDMTAGGGTIGAVGNALVVTQTTVVYTNDPVNGTIKGDLGTIHFVAVGAGNYASNSTISSGTITITIPNYVISDFNTTQTYTFTSGTWTKVTLANGTHQYTLSASFQDAAGDTGALLLQTTNIGALVFGGNAPISYLNLNLQLP